MNDSVEALEPFDEQDGAVNTVIETPKGSAVKYSYSPESHLFRAKRTLPHGMIFPFNFGFVPGTLAEDGDPLDILIVDPVPFVCGCLVKAKVLAVIVAEQTENGNMVRNDRIVGMAIDEETPPEYVSVPLDDARIRQISFFFASYNKINGKDFKHLRTGDAKEAEALVREARKRFQNRPQKQEPRLKAA
jgi:inorganic pyrophosphatase